MLESGIANITLFFVIVGMCLFFIILWITRSESKLKLSKSEIRKLKSQIESTLREKFILEDKIDSIDSSAAGSYASGHGSQDTAISEELLQEMYRKNQTLGSENKKLKKELDEARGSLEEIYKALSAKG